MQYMLMFFENNAELARRDDPAQAQDGPLPDAKEHLGGYFIIEVASLDVALEWASRSPNAAHGHTEVRPVLPPPQR